MLEICKFDPYGTLFFLGNIKNPKLDIFRDILHTIKKSYRGGAHNQVDINCHIYANRVNLRDFDTFHANLQESCNFT